MKNIEKSADPNYGISRFDDDIRNTHGWRVSLRRYGKMLVENFPDKKYGGQKRALQLARQYRDELLGKFPPISRREVCQIKRSNNKSGISGVCTYAKSYKLRDGTVKETRYWEASWPGDDGKNVSINFSVNKYGEELARSMAVRARMRGLEGVEGPFWVCERGQVNTTERNLKVKDFRKPDRRVA
ncbi:MAG: AP2 domain-containing protein [Lysobacterales bacterium]